MQGAKDHPNVFTSHKLKQDLSLCEPKPNIVTQSYYVLIALEKKAL